MVTLGELSDLPRIKVAQAFGFATRKSYYDARYDVLNGVATDLFPQRTGPKKATKRTRELEVKVIQMRFDTTYNMYEIADELNRLDFDISARLVGKILSDFGLSKKKLR
jgi:transposase